MKRKREEVVKKHTPLKSKKIKKVQKNNYYIKKSDESDTSYENRLVDVLSPLSDIYKKIDRWEGKINITKNMYYETANKCELFFKKEFKNREDIVVSPYNLSWTTKVELDQLSVKRCLEERIPITRARIKHINNKGFIRKDRTSHIEEIEKFVYSSMQNTKVQLIILPYTINVDMYESGSVQKKLTQNMLTEDHNITRDDVKINSHRCVIIINKFLKTIEFFDSNGGEFHFEYTWNEDETAIANFLISIYPTLNTSYKLYKSLDTCPNFGFQYYESRAVDINNWKTEVGIGGFCLIWSVFTAYIRTKYYYIDSDKLINVIIKKFKNKEDEYTINQPFHKFIINFFLYMKHVLDNE